MLLRSLTKNVLATRSKNRTSKRQKIATFLNVLSVAEYCSYFRTGCCGAEYAALYPRSISFKGGFVLLEMRNDVGSMW